MGRLKRGSVCSLAKRGSLDMLVAAILLGPLQMSEVDLEQAEICLHWTAQVEACYVTFSSLLVAVRGSHDELSVFSHLSLDA